MPEAHHPGGAADTLEARYGTKRRARVDQRIGWVTAGVLVLIGIAFLLFSDWQNKNQVGFQDIGYTVVDDRTVEVRFNVTAPPRSELACAVESLSASKGTVGWKVLTLDPVDDTQQGVETTLATTGEAVTGSVNHCWILEQ